MFVFTYTGFFLTAACVGFATYILSKKKHDILAFYFCLHVYAVALWVGANAFADLAQSPLTNIFWAGSAFIGVSFFVSYYLCFVYAFTHKQKPPLALRFVYFLPAVVFSLGAFSRYAIVDTLFPPGLPSQIIPGVFYKFHLVFFIVSLVYSSILLISYLLRQADFRERRQAVFMGSGFFILFAATVFFGIILPVYFNELRLFNVGPQFSVFLIILSSYAILRHRLFDIEVLIKKGLVFSLLFAAIFFLFNLAITLFAVFLPGFVSNIAAALVITLVFSPMKTWLEKATDRVLFQHHQSFDERIQVLNESLTRASSTEGFVSTLAVFFHKVIKSEKVACVIANEHGEFEQIKKLFNGLKRVRLPANSRIVDYYNHLIATEAEALTVLEVDDLDYSLAYELNLGEDKQRRLAVRKELQSIGYSVVIPFISKKKILGFAFLGHSLSRDHYTESDFRIFHAVAHEGTIALENVYNQSRAARLNELKAEFIRILSQQLRSPIIAAKWNVEMVLGQKVSRSILEPMRDVQINLLKLNEGVGSMFAVLEIAQDKVDVRRSRVNFLETVLSEALKDFQVQTAKKKIHLDLRVHAQDVFVDLDPEKIKKVVSVLVSNAVTYSPENSTVIIDVKSDKQKLVVAVEDEGFGVPKNSRKDIFEMFYRGEQARRASPEGLGVNLFIARHFVNAHHGKLVVEDRPDGRAGARFVFTLPMR